MCYISGFVCVKKDLHSLVYYTRYCNVQITITVKTVSGYVLKCEFVGVMLKWVEHTELVELSVFMWICDVCLVETNQAYQVSRAT